MGTPSLRAETERFAKERADKEPERNIRYMAVCGHRHESAEAAARCDDRKVVCADYRIIDRLARAAEDKPEGA